MSYLMLLGCCSVWVWRKPGIKEVLVTDRVHRLVITFCPVLVKNLQIGKVKESLCFWSTLYIYIYYGVSLTHGVPSLQHGVPTNLLRVPFRKESAPFKSFWPGNFACFLLFSLCFLITFGPFFTLFLPCFYPVFALFLPCFWVILGSLYLNAIYIP